MCTQAPHTNFAASTPAPGKGSPTELPRRVRDEDIQSEVGLSALGSTILGRKISNIIRGLDDVIEFQRNNNLNNLLFIIDFKQAFDKIDTEYNCLEQNNKGHSVTVKGGDRCFND